MDKKYERKILYFKCNGKSAGFGKLIVKNEDIQLELKLDTLLGDEAVIKLVTGKGIVILNRTYNLLDCEGKILINIGLSEILDVDSADSYMPAVIIKIDGKEIKGGELNLEQNQQIDENKEPYSEQNLELKVETTDKVENLLAENDRDEVNDRVEERDTAKDKELIVYEDKWWQLWNIYPHVKPFEDDREYIKITPGDFVVLTEKSYKKANNSFMLHGYHNYEHLILRNEAGKKGNNYYIGTPGIFGEKEKQAALMFGYESFEGKKETALEGDFGYYLLKAEL